MSTAQLNESEETKTKEARPKKSQTKSVQENETQVKITQTLKEIRENFKTLLDLRDRKIAELEKQLAELLGQKPQDLPKSKLLVVDDSDSMKDMVAQYLEHEPVEYLCLHGDKVKNSHLEAHDIWLIEASVKVKDEVDGMSLCSHLCKKGKGNRTVIMSSRPGDKIKDEVEKMGAVFLRKPFKRSELLSVIRAILKSEEK